MPRRVLIQICILSILGGLLVLAACTTDAERIREANTAVASSSGNSEQFTGKISIFDVRDGDCFNAPIVPETQSIDYFDVELVACSDDWSHKALNSFLVELDGDYPGDRYFENLADSGCDRRYSVLFYPLPESWALGDRVINCVLEK